jgi:hypothetical protein
MVFFHLSQIYINFTFNDFSDFSDFLKFFNFFMNYYAFLYSKFFNYHLEIKKKKN